MTQSACKEPVVEPSENAASPPPPENVPSAGSGRPKRGRFGASIRVFEIADRTNPPPQNAILFTGASNIVGWETLAEDFAGLAVINRGFGGSYITDCVFHAERIVIPYRPRMIVLRAGGNDINTGKSPEQVAADFKTFVETVRAGLPDVRIAYWSMTASIQRLANWEREQKGNELIRTFVAAGQNMVYIDTTGVTLGPDRKPRPELFSDGLHFTRDAYRAFAAIIRPYLE